VFYGRLPLVLRSRFLRNDNQKSNGKNEKQIPYGNDNQKAKANGNGKRQAPARAR
jgi:hypothetical protein